MISLSQLSQGPISQGSAPTPDTSWGSMNWNDAVKATTPTQNTQPTASGFNLLDSATKNTSDAATGLAQGWQNAPSEFAGNVEQMAKVFNGGLTLNPQTNLTQAKNFGEGLLGLLGNTVKQIYAPSWSWHKCHK